MDSYLEHQLICRACLRIVENKSQSFGYIEDSYGNLKDMIMCCVPEMDIYVSSQPIMCFSCIQLLINVYNFKTRCLNTETVIRSYIQRNNLTEYSHVNLSCVVQELIRLNNYFREMNRGKVEGHDNNAHLKITENLCNIPESQVEVQPISEMINNVIQNAADLHPTESDLHSQSESPSNKSDESELVRNRMEKCLPDKIEEPQTAQSNLLEDQIVQNNSPQPRVLGIENFQQTNLPVHHMGEGLLPFSPQHVPYNFQDRLGERILIPPHLNLDNRIGPYSLPLVRAQMPDRMFASPQFGMEQRFPPRYIVPEHLRERTYTFTPTGFDPRLPNHSLPPNHVGEQNIYRPPTKAEAVVTQAVNGGIGAHNPSARPTKEVKERSNDRVPEKDKEHSCVERNPTSENNNNGESSEKHVNGESIEKVNEEQVENRTRIILRIDKSRIKNWFKLYDKNGNSNEKENSNENGNSNEKENSNEKKNSNETENSKEKENEQDVEMSGGETSPPQEGASLLLHPSYCTQELYQCTNCMFVTTNLTSHISHKEVCLHDVHQYEKVKCPHCPHVTNRQYALKKHINTMHTKAVWYNCDYCNYRSTDPSCLRRHKRNVHTEKLGMELTCPSCAYRCTTEYHLRKHMCKHDENSILHCQFCSYSTRDRSNFRKHVFIHNPKPKECEFCDYKCVSPYQMKIHLKKYHHGVGLEDIDCRSDASLSVVVDDISNAIKESKNFMGHTLE